jgi:Mg/Co/Ni transporter MgtE
MKIPESIEKAIRSGNESELQEICNCLHPADAAAAFTALNEKQQSAKH